jgi:hypothetical protein
MTRKLAVTVFAMSLTLVGCGSSSTTKVDANPDTKVTADAGPKLDTPPVTPDTKLADSAIPADTRIADGPAIDTIIIPNPDTRLDQVQRDVVVPPVDARDSGPNADRPADRVQGDTAVSDAPQIDTANDAPAADVGGGEAGGEAGSDV